MTATVARRQRARVVVARARARGRSGYLLGAVCVAICAVMLAPLVMSVLASVKPTAEAALSPQTYLPHGLSLDSYERLQPNDMMKNATIAAAFAYLTANRDEKLPRNPLPATATGRGTTQ